MKGKVKDGGRMNGKKRKVREWKIKGESIAEDNDSNEKRYVKMNEM